MVLNEAAEQLPLLELLVTDPVPARRACDWWRRASTPALCSECRTTWTRNRYCLEDFGGYIEDVICASCRAALSAVLLRMVPR